MADGDKGTEPGGWELMRAIESLRKTVESSAGKSVSIEVYNIQIASLVRDLTDVKATRLVDAKALEDYKTAQDDQRGKVRLLVYGIFAGPLVTLLVTFVANGGLSR